MASIPSPIFIEKFGEIEVGNSTINTTVLFDGDMNTCLNANEAFLGITHYMVELIITSRVDNGLIRVYYNHTMQCEERQVCLINYA